MKRDWTVRPSFALLIASDARGCCFHRPEEDLNMATQKPTPAPAPAPTPVQPVRPAQPDTGKRGDIPPPRIR